MIDPRRRSEAEHRDHRRHAQVDRPEPSLLQFEIWIVHQLADVQACAERLLFALAQRRHHRHLIDRADPDGRAHRPGLPRERNRRLDGDLEDLLAVRGGHQRRPRPRQDLLADRTSPRRQSGRRARSRTGGRGRPSSSRQPSPGAGTRPARCSAPGARSRRVRPATGGRSPGESARRRPPRPPVRPRARSPRPARPPPSGRSGAGGASDRRLPPALACRPRPGGAAWSAPRASTGSHRRLSGRARCAA